VNSVGEVVRNIVDFRVEFSPVTTATKIMYTHMDPSKRDMDVQCLVEAYPAPKIDWLYNGVILIGDNNKRYTKPFDWILENVCIVTSTFIVGYF